MQEHNISTEEIKQIKSVFDPAAKKLASETPEGVNQFYHVIGTMGGMAVRDKYSNLSGTEAE